MKHRPLLLIAIISVLAAACSSSTDVSESDTTTSVTTQATTTTVAAATTSTEQTTTTQTVPQERTFTGIDGVETVVSDISAIVSLTGDITEVIFELGLGSNVVGVDVTTTYPPQAAAMNEQGSTVGFAQQLAPEAVLRFNPSLVIGDQTIAPQETIDQLRAAGVPVVILETRTTLEGALAKIDNVAEILDVPEAGAELILRVGGEIDAARTLAATAPGQPTIAYIYTRGPQLMLLFGLGMPTQAMIEGANAIDAAVASGVRGPAPVTPEALIAAAPEVIVLPEAGIAAMGGLDAFKEIPGIAQTPAGQTDSFLVYDEGYFFNLGPRVGLALDEFVNDLYPDLGG